MSRLYKLGLLIIVIITLDMFTKAYIAQTMIVGESIPVIANFFSITFVKNSGAAFGMGAEFHYGIRLPLFLLIPLIACFWLLWLLWKARKGSLMDSIAYALILAGAVGNLYDRFTAGYVIDFLDFYHKNTHFPAFNVADSSITVAAILLILNAILTRKKEKQK